MPARLCTQGGRAPTPRLCTRYRALPARSVCSASPNPRRRNLRIDAGGSLHAVPPPRTPAPPRPPRPRLAPPRLPGRTPYPPRVVPEPLLDPLAAHGVTSAVHAGRPPGAPLDEADWARVVRKAARDRSSGLLAGAVAAGWYPATGGQAAEAAAAGAHAAAIVDVLESALGAVVEELDDRGVRTLVLKGAAHARILEDDRRNRGFGDLDLFVHPDDVDRAGQVLGQLGATRSYRQPRPGFDRRFWKGGVYEFDGGIVVDLHCRLAVGALGLGVDPAALIASSRPFRCGGADCRALGSDEMLLHALLVPALAVIPATHSLRDVGLALDQPDVDVARALALAQRWGLSVAVARTWRDAQERLGLAHDVLDPWARSFRATRRERSRLSVHTAEDHTHARAVLSTLAALPGVRDRAAFASALLLPDASSGRRGLRRGPLRRRGHTSPGGTP